MNHYLHTDHTFANEDYEAYVNAAIGAGPYHTMYFEGLFLIEQILHENKVVHSTYLSNEVIEDITRLTEAEFSDLTDKEQSFYQAFQPQLYSPQESLGYRHHRMLEKAKTQVIDDFVIEKESKHGMVLIIFTARQESNYRMKIVTKDLKALHAESSTLLERYLITERNKVASRENPMLHIVKPGQNSQLYLAEVPLKVNRVMNEKELMLHYGKGISQLQEQLRHSLKSDQCGLHLFQGAPGMGKTTFVSHLCSELAGQHKLVYVPNSSFEKLISPDHIDFWADACDDLKEGAKIILVVEDAESILLKRNQNDSANASAVSSLLNLCDGLLGQMLGLHVLATANADFEGFDEAILRAGRLKTRHIFQLLNKEAALALAQHLDSELVDTSQEHYTIAEIYNKPLDDEGSPHKRTIGFITEEQD